MVLQSVALGIIAVGIVEFRPSLTRIACGANMTIMQPASSMILTEYAVQCPLFGGGSKVT
jgi:hypothetical protein